MHFSSINERLILAFKKAVCFVFFRNYKLFNTVINNFRHGMSRIFDVLKYSAIMNVFLPTFADWFMMTHFMKLANSSRSRCSQTMKFGQFIEYNMRNNFVREVRQGD